MLEQILVDPELKKEVEAGLDPEMLGKVVWKDIQKVPELRKALVRNLARDTDFLRTVVAQEPATKVRTLLPIWWPLLAGEPATTVHTVLHTRRALPLQVKV